jgi:PAS domain S-box-containing protein
MGLFGDSVFTPFHGTNECLSQTLSILLFSDSSTKTVPDYAVRDAESDHFDNLMLNSLNFLRSVLQVQIIQNTRETMKLHEAIQAGNEKINYLQNSQQEDLIRIIDDAPVAIWMGDADERTVFANSRFSELVGYPKEAMIGMESFDFWEPESIKTVQNNNEVRIKGEKSTYEACLLSKNKEIIPVRLTGIPISTGTVGMMLDLRELRKEELQRAALQQLSDSKDSFLNIASHELRTPITSILGYISMLIDGDYGDLPEPAVQSLTIVQSSGKRLFNIINHMLQLAKLESGNIVLQEVPIFLSEICESIMSEVHAIALERRIGMSFEEVDLKEPPIVIGDADQVRKAILNLVGNSLKFTQ